MPGDGHTSTNAPTEATTGNKETTPTTAKQQPTETSTKKAPCPVTTASPPTSPPSDKKPLQCGVAVVGGGKIARALACIVRGLSAGNLVPRVFPHPKWQRGKTRCVKMRSIRPDRSILRKKQNPTSCTACKYI